MSPLKPQPPAPMILAVAPNGARRGKGDHAALPMSVAEIAEEAKACHDAGASLLHLHVRDNAGRHSLDPIAYQQAIAAIRRLAGEDLVIQITTEAAGCFGREVQIETALAVDADSVSLAVREICPTEAEEKSAGDVYRALAEKGVIAQHILYDAADVSRFNDLRRRGVIPAFAPFLQLVLGRYGEGSAGGPADFFALMKALKDSDAIWSVCCFGFWETMAVAAAAAYGGHARVGFENSFHARDSSIARSNSQRVEECAELIRATGRPLADGAFVWRRMRPSGRPGA